MTITHCPRTAPAGVRRATTLALAIGLLGAVAATAQVTPDQMAQMILDSAKKAYNEKTYPVAVQRYREYLAKFGNHKDVPIARYGLALSILEIHPKDYNAALQELNAVAGVKNFPEQPFVSYYQGVANRGLGVQFLAQIAAKPQEAAQLRAQAKG